MTAIFEALSYTLGFVVLLAVAYICFRGMQALGEWLAERVARKVSK